MDVVHNIIHVYVSVRKEGDGGRGALQDVVDESLGLTWIS